MKIDLNGMLYALSYALDCVEGELTGIKPGHGKWVAYFCVCMGKEYGMTQEQLFDLASCAVLHDNALTQYLSEERGEAVSDGRTAGKHCIFGEENMKDFPFYTDVRGVILYHHENADGSGFFKKKAEETPLMAQMIHLADLLDVSCRIHEVSAERWQSAERFLASGRDRLFDGSLVELFFRSVQKEQYLALAGRQIDGLLSGELPGKPKEYPFYQVQSMLKVFGKIVDYKSRFTRNHSEQIAEKLMRVAEAYGYGQETKERLYVAGMLHDIGKMAIHNDVLEKPDRLTEDEFVYMQNHAWYTYVILSQISGFEDITRWASRHHEKLNGKGYPFGLKAGQLDEKERLLACIDIYQALGEDRPYKPGLPHEKCIEIMRDMAQNGFIDGKITDDLERIFAQM